MYPYSSDIVLDFALAQLASYSLKGVLVPIGAVKGLPSYYLQICVSLQLVSVCPTDSFPYQVALASPLSPVF